MSWSSCVVDRLFGVDLLVVLVGDDLLDLIFLVGLVAFGEFAGYFVAA